MTYYPIEEFAKGKTRNGGPPLKVIDSL